MNPNGMPERPVPGSGGSDPLKTLESKLYSPNVSRGELFPDARRNLAENTPRTDQGIQWEPINIEQQPEHPQRFRASKFVKWFFIVSLLFCLGAVGFALYYFFSDQLVISSKNIDINVTAPVRVNGGEALPLSIEIANKNRQQLTDIHVTIEYPDDSRNPASPDMQLLRDEKDIPLIAAGSSQHINSSALVYGEERQEKKVLVRIEYGIASTQSRFSKEKEYQFIIDRSPLSVDVQYQNELDAGQEAVFMLSITSNVEAPISDVMLIGTFPFNFSMQSSDPAAQGSDNRTWKLGTIRPGQKKIVTIRGVINGLEDEERSFRFVLGTTKPEADDQIATTLSSKTVSVQVKRPSVAIAFDPRERASDNSAVATFGKEFEEAFSVRNNLNQAISRPTIEVRVVGDYHDSLSLNGKNGFFRSSDKVLLWSGGQFLTLQPEEQQEYVFNMNMRDLSSFASRLKNPTFEVAVTLKGTILDDGGRSQQIEVTSRQTVKFRTTLVQSSAVLFSGTSFRNQGPVPPRPDVPTTMTVRLQLANGLNHVSNAVVRTTLPIYVDFVAASSSSVVYNDFNRSLTWTIGELPAYTGVGSSPASADIQLSFTPSTSQRGTSPDLTAPILIEGTDRITGQRIEVTRPAPTIETIDGTSGIKVQ